MIDELHEAMVVRIASYQQRITNLYNKRVKQRAFQVGDLVLRMVFENTANLAANKFQPNWEGLYMIVRVRASISYALNNLDRMPMPRM